MSFVSHVAAGEFAHIDKRDHAHALTFSLAASVAVGRLRSGTRTSEPSVSAREAWLGSSDVHGRAMATSRSGI